MGIRALKTLLLLILLLLQRTNSIDRGASANNVTLFQTLDASFVVLWLNWWVVALEFGVIPPSWNIYIACFGRHTAELVQLFHSPGCSRVYTEDEVSYKRRIYFAKWLAITEAYNKGNDLLVVDIDALLLRNPLQVLRESLVQSTPQKNDLFATATWKSKLLSGVAGNRSSRFADIDEYDIIASRDHGPGKLPYSEHWGPARLCTGLIYLRQRPAVKELVEFSLERCRSYGHDQIQLNNVLSRSALFWRDRASNMADSKVHHEGFLTWFHQLHVDFNIWRREHLLREPLGHYPDGDLDLRLLPLLEEVDHIVALFEVAAQGLSSRNQVTSSDERAGTDRGRNATILNLLVQRAQLGGKVIRGVPEGKKQRKNAEAESSDAAWQPPNVNITQRWSGDPPVLIPVLLLSGNVVRRYCNEKQLPVKNWVQYLEPLALNMQQRIHLSSLHCFVSNGPMPEQGAQKRDLKTDVFRKLLLWGLKKDVKPHAPKYFSKAFVGSDFHQPKAHATMGMLRSLKDEFALTKMREHWLNGAHHLPWNKPKSKPQVITDHRPKPRPVDVGVIPAALMKQEKRKREQMQRKQRHRAQLSNISNIDRG